MSAKNISQAAWIIFSLVLAAGCSRAMHTEELRQIGYAIWNKGDLSLIDKNYSPDFVYHSAGRPDIKGAAGYRQFTGAILKAFPDFHVTIDDILIEGDTFARRYVWTGTNTGPLQLPEEEIPATGKKVRVEGMAITRMKDGKVVEEYDLGDSVGMFQQLGLLPAAK